MEKITWLEGLETEDMINIVKSKFPKKNIWMEFGTIWADDLSETEALDLGVMLTGLTACEVTIMSTRHNHRAMGSICF